MTFITSTRARTARAAALFTALAAVAACGSSTSTSAGNRATTTASATSAATVTTTAAPSTNAAAAAANAPKAIISLSATATEILFAIGAGKQVVAVDDQSNFPADAPKTDLSGFTPNVEAIAGRKPDLVVISDDGAKLVDALGKLGIKTLLQTPAKTLDDTYRQIDELGTATGHRAEATKVASDIKTSLADIVAKSPKVSMRIYHEVDDTLYSASSSSFIGQIYKLFGMENIADKADKDATGFPQLSPEYLATANPQVIFLADTKCCKQSATTLAARPGWADIDAVKKNKVIELDDDIASRWGPRVVDLARTIATSFGA
jgi:iron complex transport system substrate-binding protein